jgi:hypothetical protein
MDVHNRFQRRSLRDVLVSQGILTDEIADELVSSARETNEPLGMVIVEAGYLTSWDLAKCVATHWQMPIIPLAGFQFDKELVEGLSPATLYQFHVVPVGRFGSVRSFAVIEPPSRDCLESLHEACGKSLFFFVAELPEIQRILRDNVKVVDTQSDRSWESVFDVGDQNVLETP